MQVYNTHQKELVADIAYHDWLSKLELKRYSDRFLDIIYFFLLAIKDHLISSTLI